MMLQRRLSSQIMKCSKKRVKFDTSRLSDIKEAITSNDIRGLINAGAIMSKMKRGISSSRNKKRILQKRKGRRQGEGSRKGKIGTRAQRKKLWIKRIRALRKTLKELAEQKKIGKAAYRTLYKMSKSGFFRSRAHLMLHAEKEGMLKQQKSK